MASAPPYNLPLATALGRNDSLSSILQRLRLSQARLQAITPALSPGLRAAVSAGPLDETAWVLLAANGAVAAKLRQMVPDLQATLLAAGWDGTPIKIKVLSPG